MRTREHAVDGHVCGRCQQHACASQRSLRLSVATTQCLDEQDHRDEERRLPAPKGAVHQADPRVQGHARIGGSAVRSTQALALPRLAAMHAVTGGRGWRGDDVFAAASAPLLPLPPRRHVLQDTALLRVQLEAAAQRIHHGTRALLLRSSGVAVPRSPRTRRVVWAPLGVGQPGEEHLLRRLRGAEQAQHAQLCSQLGATQGGYDLRPRQR